MVYLKKEPINNSSGFCGFILLIKGRPGKSSRSRTIVYKFGQIKPAELSNFNIFKTYYTSSAHTGSFGITIIAST